MAQSKREIKRRIRGISNTKQITKAMELVASSKLRKTRKKLEKTEPYFETVLDSIRGILSSTKGIRHPFLEKREVKKSAYIVVTGDRGLAGGYNYNIIRMVENEIKDKKDDVYIVAVGSKSRDYFKGRGYNVINEVIGISETPKFSDANAVGTRVIDMYRDGEIQEVKLAYTNFITTLNQETKLIRLLPSEGFGGDNEKRELIDYEPSPEEVLDYLIPKYVIGTIYGALIESSCSEQGARRTAMKSATDNAEDIIDELELRYNRARQASITSEISEIVAGVEALK